jgi:2-keto-3-deoxy-L-rhamnonate aldolase RhmA
MDPSFREKLLNGDLLVGSVISIPSPEVAEIFCAAGFDWLFVDAEHGALDPLGSLPLLRAAGNRPCVIRVPSTDKAWIQKALDMGADGIIIPDVKTAADAAKGVGLCKYPPEGSRGVGIGRAHKFGLQFEEYLESANRTTAVIVQAEHCEAVRHMEDIVRVEGIDAVLVGPYDLSASMGKTGQTEDPEVRQAVEQVRLTCRQRGIRLGIFGLSADAVTPCIEKGFTLLAVGTDAWFLLEAARSALADVRSKLSSGPARQAAAASGKGEYKGKR